MNLAATSGSPGRPSNGVANRARDLVGPDPLGLPAVDASLIKPVSSAVDLATDSLELVQISERIELVLRPLIHRRAEAGSWRAQRMGIVLAASQATRAR